MLLSVDSNNAGGKIQLNLQCTTQSGNTEDCSPDHLFTSVDPGVAELPIYVALAALYDNYAPSPGTVEDHTEQEQQEELALLELITATEVMKTTYQFLVDKEVFTGSAEDWFWHLYDMWFGMYDRARTILGSSGFEHVFIGECCKKGAVGGFHNWFHWYYLEQAGELNYLGYWETAKFGENMEHGGGISFTYTWDGTPKPYGSMFLGTSPELEMALYTTCLMTRPDAKCHITLEGTDVYIQTWREVQGDMVMVGSSYPDWAPGVQARESNIL
jgi:poly(U)-specific endoribonuclease